MVLTTESVTSVRLLGSLWHWSLYGIVVALLSVLRPICKAPYSFASLLRTEWDSFLSSHIISTCRHRPNVTPVCFSSSRGYRSKVANRIYSPFPADPSIIHFCLVSLSSFTFLLFQDALLLRFAFSHIPLCPTIISVKRCVKLSVTWDDSITNWIRYLTRIELIHRKNQLETTCQFMSLSTCLSWETCYSSATYRVQTHGNRKNSKLASTEESLCDRILISVHVIVTWEILLYKGNVIQQTNVDFQG